jgi:hypothetical protein
MPNGVGYLTPLRRHPPHGCLSRSGGRLGPRHGCLSRFGGREAPGGVCGQLVGPVDGGWTAGRARGMLLRMGTRWWFDDLTGPFRGSEAVATGAVTSSQLRGPQFRRIFRDVYLPAVLPLTHEVRCQGAALILPAEAVITGRSAATLRGLPLARTEDPVEAVVGLETRVFRRAGLDLRRCEVRDDETEMWSGVRLATRQRMAFDLLLDRSLPDAVADLDASLRAALVGRQEMQLYLAGRRDRGIVQARRALELADPRAESLPESRMRVHLALDGLHPEVQYRVYHRGHLVGRAGSRLPRAPARCRVRRGVARCTAAGWAGPRTVESPARGGLGRRLHHRAAPSRASSSGMYSPRGPRGTPSELNTATSIHVAV